MLVWLLACGGGGGAEAPWTPESALAPHLARLDTDADGRVTDTEYTRTRRDGPPFATADQDGDGALGAGELVWLVRAQSPTTFDGDALPVRAKIEAPQPRALTGGARDVAEVLVWMGDALRAAGDPGPDPAAVAAAVETGRLDSVETQAVLDAMRPAWTARGWGWPAL